MTDVISRRDVLLGAPSAAVSAMLPVRAEVAAQGRGSSHVSHAVAVPTFHSIGLYWRPRSVSSDRTAAVSYRAATNAIWKKGHSLWLDRRVHAGVPERSRECRGSIVGLQPGTEYEIEIRMEPDGERVRLVARTWDHEFPVGRKIGLAPKSNKTLEIQESGSPGAYVLYSPSQRARAENDVDGKADYNIIIDASYVIVRQLDLRNARRHAIVLRRRAHHVVIENNDISGWGRIAEDGFGVDGDSAISNDETDDGKDRVGSAEIRTIVIQNNKIHHPRSNSNHWKQFRKRYGSSHPAGPQAITLWDTGGNHVIRNNEIYSDEGRYFNDGIGGGENFGYYGSPGPDSDIYANRISHCWDDAIESEGGNTNVRIWGNFIDKTYIMIGASPTTFGPLYIFRNVCYRGRYSSQHNFNTGAFIKAQSKQVRDHFWGGGRVYVYHNTLLRTSAQEGTYAGVSGFGTDLLNYVSRNNIYDNTKSGMENLGPGSPNDFDNDLYTSMQGVGEQQRHGIHARPRYQSVEDFTLVKGSAGHDDGAFIPNFSDEFVGLAPDRGAQELGAAPLRFGCSPEW
jgi:Right handed beta helix region